jgi:hypothetical protein
LKLSFLGTRHRSSFDDRQSLDIYLVVIIYLATPLEEVALKRAHTRENPERPLATPVADPEKIIRRGRAYKGKLPEQQGHLDQVSQEVFLLYLYLEHLPLSLLLLKLLFSENCK